jgi:2Fe-2S ferredoxin
MIDFTGLSDPNLRLGCQIKLTDDLDGLVVRTPESQY